MAFHPYHQLLVRKLIQRKYIGSTHEDDYNDVVAELKTQDLKVSPGTLRNFFLADSQKNIYSTTVNELLNCLLDFRFENSSLLKSQFESVFELPDHFKGEYNFETINHYRDKKKYDELARAVDDEIKDLSHENLSNLFKDIDFSEWSFINGQYYVYFLAGQKEELVRLLLKINVEKKIINIKYQTKNYHYETLFAKIVDGILYFLVKQSDHKREKRYSRQIVIYFAVKLPSQEKDYGLLWANYHTFLPNGVTIAGCELFLKVNESEFVEFESKDSSQLEEPRDQRIRALLEENNGFYPRIYDYNDLEEKVFHRTVIKEIRKEKWINHFAKSNWFLYYYSNLNRQISKAYIRFINEEEVHIQKNGNAEDDYYGSYKNYGEIVVLNFGIENTKEKFLQLVIGAKEKTYQSMALGVWQNYKNKKIVTGTLVIVRDEDKIEDVEKQLMSFNTYQAFRENAPKEIVHFFNRKNAIFIEILNNYYALSELKKSSKSIFSVENVYHSVEFYIEVENNVVEEKELAAQLIAQNGLLPTQAVLHSASFDEFNKAFPPDFIKAAIYILVIENFSYLNLLRLGYAFQENKTIYIYTQNSDLKKPNEFAQNINPFSDLDDILDNIHDHME